MFYCCCETIQVHGIVAYKIRHNNSTHKNFQEMITFDLWAELICTHSRFNRLFLLFASIAFNGNAIEPLNGVKFANF